MSTPSFTGPPPRPVDGRLLQRAYSQVRSSSPIRAASKQYQLRAGQNVTVHMDPTPHSEITYTMNDGPFEGQDPRNLVDQAIIWISAYLDEVDRRAKIAEEPAATSKGL